ncbi:GNAT family N-acetyltransferase [Arthrobacter tecti]
MSITLATPDVANLGQVLEALRSWQHDGMPIQLHPGDIGWAWQIGASALAERLRIWSLDGSIHAVGLLDGPTLLRLAVAPDASENEELAARILTDVTDPSRGVLPSGTSSVEARFGTAIRSGLQDAGWMGDEPWTPFARDLTAPVQECGMRIETVGPELANARVQVQNASFDNSRFSEERWRTMANGPAYTDARCLLAYDEQGSAVATATVWSAGINRPGLIEPMGVAGNQRGHGYGTAITLAAAAALQEMGSPSALGCAESANVGAVATYKAAGFTCYPEVHDFRRNV